MAPGSRLFVKGAAAVRHGTISSINAVTWGATYALEAGDALQIEGGRPDPAVLRREIA